MDLYDFVPAFYGIITVSFKDHLNLLCVPYVAVEASHILSIGA